MALGVAGTEAPNGCLTWRALSPATGNFPPPSDCQVIPEGVGWAQRGVGMF